MIWVFVYLVFVVSMLSVAMLAGVVMGMDARIEDADEVLGLVDDVTELVEQYANRSAHPAWPKARYTERQVAE